MQTQIVSIGNSYGLRLPKPVLDALQLEKASQVSIQVRKDSIVLRPAPKPATQIPRKGWFSVPVVDSADDATWAELDAALLSDTQLDSEWQW